MVAKRRPTRNPDTLEHALRIEIIKACEVDEPRIKNLALCLTEDLQIAGCSHLQAILALTTALKRVCDEQPEPEIVRKVVSSIFWVAPPKEGEEADT